MLMYADSSDDEDMEQDVDLGESLEIFSNKTRAVDQRRDSLREVVMLKDAQYGSQSFNEK